MNEITEPCVSGATFDIVVLGFLVGIAGFCALAAAAHWFAKIAREYRLANLGRRLVEVSGGDWPTAIGAVEAFEASNAEFDRAMRERLRLARTLRLVPEFAERRAAFNEADAEYDGGARWQDVQ